MPDQKLDNLLNLALDATEEEREKSRNLNVGYEKQTRKWEIIVKYSEMGDSVEALLGGSGISVVPLLGGYAIVTLPESMLEEYSRRPQIEFIEKPTRLYFEDLFSKEASCITQVQRDEPGNLQLTGRGVLIGIVDSGVDYRHPAFLTADGKSRILRLWDQSIPGNPPEGYTTGTEYTNEEINEALSLSVQEGRRLVPSEDVSGHGTAVLGVAAGSDFSRGSVNRGVAYESDLLVVKMGIPRQDSFPRTTELMQGVDYLVRQAIRMGRPIAINLSFGNNYGSHRGDSLLETYLDNVSGMGKNVICVGMGNNGNDALHTGGMLSPGEIQEIELGVGAFEPTLNVQLWKNYEDEMEIYLEHPAGERVGPLFETLGAQRWQAGNTKLLIYYGKPAPYHVTQEIYVDFLPQDEKTPYVDSGVWKIILAARNIKNGEYFLWLPGGKTLNPGTAFYLPRPQGTLTIPATARRVISVGAYDARQNTYADFSGRGCRALPYPKPDLAAPGVDIYAPRPGGGYAAFTGTSFSTPFVTGAAALLMEWGIIRRNDPYLYGEKLKAYLRRGAKALQGSEKLPNDLIGWGRLCLESSLPE
ncbi:MULTISPECIES: S8 family peptidase [unclassified Ruminococcus]|uniref:S8 family peptidase n=1 Tax=unclassified Ruminococcus TaxID=2608920 RepID=UPI00189F1639|nr:MULTISPECIES: S8 family peptidase [unclassified Ruminococcus]MDB8756966.1 S8 family serine peptidase [Ruminococcus sp. 1001136sp1]MDB8760932.1 S8 family serine peptidase [Ruminococcus sp. 1001136sp1]MDB8765167.1 S8 family serine peptidase [Ruminococcus sp. 1001136sp1]MDB8769067.1 S8 family serine peptidase [Ruminococcus sp. 1001136sp1]